MGLMKYAKYAKQAEQAMNAAQSAYNKHQNKPSSGQSGQGQQSQAPSQAGQGQSFGGQQGQYGQQQNQQQQQSTSSSYSGYPGSRPRPSAPQPPSGPPPSLNELGRWFDYYDSDRSGSLDREEVVNALVQTTGNYSGMQSLRDTVYGVWSTFDRDHSGGIDKREFLMPGGLGESLQAMFANETKPSAPAQSQSAQPSQPQYQLMRAQIPAGMQAGQALQVRSPYTGQVLAVNIPPQPKWVYPQAGGPPAFDFKVPTAPAPPVVMATAVAVGAGAGGAAYGAHGSYNANSNAAPHPHMQQNTAYATHNNHGNAGSQTQVQQQPWQAFDSFRGGYYQAPPLGLTNVQVPQYRNPIQPSGRRRALLIGINYRGTRAALKGCINDATNMRNTLLRQGYPNDSSHMVLLTDESRDRNYQPTGATILKAMQWLVQGTSQGDVLFFHFSGHGAQVPDKTGHESDGMNETILPSDYKTKQLTDDELWGSLVYPLPSGVRLMAIMDCCHSGTGLDLPYDYKLGGSASSQKMPTSFGGASSALNSFMSQATQQYAGGTWVEDVNPAHSKGDVVLFSGCEDAQTSADVQDKYAGAGGAMTQAFLKAYEESPRASYPQFLAAIHKNLKQRGFKQRPQLTASQKFDVNGRVFSFTDGIEPNQNSQIGRMKRRHVKPGKGGYGSGGGFDIDDLFKGGAVGKVAAVAVGAALLSSMFD